MTFSHLNIEPVPGRLDEVIDENSDYSQKVKAQRSVALAAPAMLATLREVRASIDVSLIRDSKKATAHWTQIADNIDAIFAAIEKG